MIEIRSVAASVVRLERSVRAFWGVRKFPTFDIYLSDSSLKILQFDVCKLYPNKN